VTKAGAHVLAHATASPARHLAATTTHFTLATIVSAAAMQSFSAFKQSLMLAGLTAKFIASTTSVVSAERSGTLLPGCKQPPIAHLMKSAQHLNVATQLPIAPMWH